MSQIIPHAKGNAIRILVAEELGFKPQCLRLAKQYIEDKVTLTDSQFNSMSMAGYKAVNEIQEKGLEDKALELAKKYL